MEIPASYVINSTLEVGRIYKFSAPELIEIEEPHFYIVIAIVGDNNYALISTTQLNKRIQYVESRGISKETICYIEPNDGNELTKDSYLDCNSYFELPNYYLESKVKEGVLEIKGIISDDDFEKIKYSISRSPLFDLPLDLVKK
ncbi:hypothetical protein [Sphingobacterium sp. UME9]|uniref:hypothetical protein n=1 Tax=Sphingobacterium sp. UME9 TaxID=1862316 RepID=UPI0016020C45|nr:hypothetical protein [Sphingobacterium sp. UME9]MBB1644952.1 hypothetical protein [Sphingobacterium sp. UME9]